MAEERESAASKERGRRWKVVYSDWLEKRSGEVEGERFTNPAMAGVREVELDRRYPTRSHYIDLEVQR